MSMDIDWRGRSVLCLAARIGTEVKAFLDVGAFAVGIDLNPGEANRYVLYGDFHALQFSDASIDFVFTNSLDHAFDLGRLSREAARVLKPGGMLLVEALRGRREGAQPGFFESFWWQSIDELIAALAKNGFTLQQRAAINYPWEGEALGFSLAQSGG
jgi:SAM-dependent methyltransferase